MALPAVPWQVHRGLPTRTCGQFMRYRRAALGYRARPWTHPQA